MTVIRRLVAILAADVATCSSPICQRAPRRVLRWLKDLALFQKMTSYGTSHFRTDDELAGTGSEGPI